MSSWDPENLTKLNFSNTKLTQFHIGTLVHLEELDLSHNQITVLLGTGVEQASHLKRLNLSHNRITSKRQLLALQYKNKHIFFFFVLKFSLDLFLLCVFFIWKAIEILIKT